MNRGDIKIRCSKLTPYLSDKNKTERLEFILSFIDPVTRKFHSMHDRIHVDDKWFYLKQGKLNALSGPDEDIPHRTVQSKRFITKVMFTYAVARPRFDKDAKVLFEGKIGF